jgi:hypothetical protein
LSENKPAKPEPIEEGDYISLEGKLGVVMEIHPGGLCIVEMSENERRLAVPISTLALADPDQLPDVALDDTDANGNASPRVRNGA